MLHLIQCRNGFDVEFNADSMKYKVKFVRSRFHLLYIHFYFISINHLIASTRKRTYSIFQK